MSRWLKAARAEYMPVQLAQKGAVRSENTEIRLISELTDPNCTNCTRIETETERPNTPPSKLEICGQCAVIVQEGQEFLHVVANGFPGVIHLDCYDAWYDAHIRGRFRSRILRQID